jgi:hypothetical protein
MAQLNLGCFNTELGKELLEIRLNRSLCLSRYPHDRAFEVESFG